MYVCTYIYIYIRTHTQSQSFHWSPITEFSLNVLSTVTVSSFPHRHPVVFHFCTPALTHLMTLTCNSSPAIKCHR